MHMNAPGMLLVWMLMAIVALPLSPCALIASACYRDLAKATIEVAHQPVRSCCADSTQPAERPSHNEPQNPYAGCCCRLSSLGPTVEKVALAAPPLAVSMGWAHVAKSSSGDVVSLTAALEQSLSLHVLHCRWRC